MMGKTAFRGLDSLTVLDLSDSRRFLLNDPVKYPYFLNALSGKNILPKLDLLNQENVGIFDSRPFKVETSFFRTVLHKNIKAVKLRGQTLLVDFKFQDIWTAQPYIPFPLVSLQASTMVVVIADNVNAENKWTNIPFWTVFRNLQYLSLSDFNLPRLSTQTYIPDRVFSVCRENSTGDTFTMTLFVFLVEISLRNFKIGNIDSIENLKIDASSCTIMRLKTIRINHSGIRKLNLTWRIPHKKMLE